jgi:hypothetical protein
MASKQEIRDYFAKFGRKGGKATAKKMTPEERTEKMRRAAQARWAKEKQQIETSLHEINDTTERLEQAAQARRAKKEKAAK